jgi:hypothetical protein
MDLIGGFALWICSVDLRCGFALWICAVDLRCGFAGNINYSLLLDTLKS